MLKEILSNSWRMTNVSTGETYETTVPCSVMSVLLDNGKIEDPYYRDNADHMLPIFQQDYEFSTEFTINGDNMRHDVIDMVFYGIDTVADIYINDIFIAQTADMHRTYRYTVREYLNLGINRLRIYIHSPLKIIDEYVPGENKEIGIVTQGAIKGNQYIRKSHSMFGWDWGPQLPDMGIFRSVEIQSYSKARIIDLFVSQNHVDGRIFVKIDPVVKIIDNIPIDITVTMTDQQPANSVIRMLEPGRTHTRKGENTIELQVNDPKLWWPNGMGEPYLYDLKVTIGKSGNIYDERNLKIGLRTITLDRSDDEYGQKFAFVVNGRELFAMGASYIPEDCFYSRITRKRQEYLVKSAAAANFNMLRVWGGGYYPSDDFYDLCDKYGILVWQDLMFACNAYELTKDFEENITAEIKDNVKRIRHHASLALWCGNNELESAWNGWPEYQQESPYVKADYVKIFEYIIPKIMKQADPYTLYWPSSPSSGGCFDNPDDESRGDSHFWDVWHGRQPFTEYRNHYFRFCSEFGFQSFPGKKTVQSFTLPEDRNVFSKVMESHQKNNEANGKILYYLSENFLYPKDFNSLLYVSQVLQAIAIKYAVDHMRRNRDRCNGALFWQFNDNWPVASWSSIDFCGRWKVLQYMAKHFFTPVYGCLSVDVDEFGVEKMSASAAIINDGFLPVGVKVIQCLKNFDGKVLVKHEDSCHPLAGKVVRLRSHNYRDYIEKEGRENVYLEARFVYTEGEIQTDYITFAPYKYLNLKKPTLAVEVTENKDCYSIEIQSDTFTPFVVLELKSGDCTFDDNAFYLEKDMIKVIKVYKSSISGRSYDSIDEFKKDISINYLQKSYMITKPEKEVVVVEKEVEKVVEKIVEKIVEVPVEKIVEVPVETKAQKTISAEKLDESEDDIKDTISERSEADLLKEKESIAVVEEVDDATKVITVAQDYFPTGHIAPPPKQEDEYSKVIDRMAKRKAEREETLRKARESIGMIGEGKSSKDDKLEVDVNSKEDATDKEAKTDKEEVVDKSEQMPDPVMDKIAMIAAKHRGDNVAVRDMITQKKTISKENKSDNVVASDNNKELSVENSDENALPIVDESAAPKKTFADRYKGKISLEEPAKINFISDGEKEHISFNKLDHAEIVDSSLFDESSQDIQEYSDEYAEEKLEEAPELTEEVYSEEYNDEEYYDEPLETKQDDIKEETVKEHKHKKKKKTAKSQIPDVQSIPSLTESTGILGLVSGLSGKKNKKMSAKELDEMLPYDDVPSLADVEKARQMYGLYDAPITDDTVYIKSSKPVETKSDKEKEEKDVKPQAIVPSIPGADEPLPYENIPAKVVTVQRDEPRIPSVARMIQGLDAAAEQKVYEETGVLPVIRKGGYSSDDMYYEEGIYQDGYMPQDFVESVEEYSDYMEQAPVQQPVKDNNNDIYKAAVRRLKKK